MDGSVSYSWFSLVVLPDIHSFILFLVYQEYEPDSRYEMPFITKAVDSEATQNIPYPSEVIPPCHLYVQVRLL